MKSKYILAIFFAVYAFSSLGCKSTLKVSEKLVKEKQEEKPMMTLTASGLEYRITKEGTGEYAANGDIVSVHYTGTFENGEVFDSSVERGQPIEFKLGEGRVIQGWEEGIKFLNKGSRAIFRIPSGLAYGDTGAGPIPPGATLIFEVELVDLKKAPKPIVIAGLETKQTQSGLKYTVVSSLTGSKKIEAGMRVKVHYNGFFEDGKLFDSSYQRGNPIEIMVGKGMIIQGLEQGLQLLSIGDRAQLFIPYNLGYGEQGRGPIPGSANLIFDVEIVDAVEVEKPKPFAVEGLPVMQIDTGLKYIVVEEGKGAVAQPGNLVVVHYTGYLEDGTIFDSSVERGDPFRFRLGQGNVIAGWDQGFAVLSKGSKARLIIPANLGYGSRPMGPIPPNSTLIFDVQLIDIQP